MQRSQQRPLTAPPVKQIPLLLLPSQSMGVCSVHWMAPAIVQTQTSCRHVLETSPLGSTSACWRLVFHLTDGLAIHKRPMHRSQVDHNPLARHAVVANSRMLPRDALVLQHYVCTRGPACTNKCLLAWVVDRVQCVTSLMSDVHAGCTTPLLMQCMPAHAALHSASTCTALPLNDLPAKHRGRLDESDLLYDLTVLHHGQAHVQTSRRRADP